MKVRVFTLGFRPTEGRFDDEELRAFVDGHEVMDVRYEFFTHGQSPYLMVLLAYQGDQAGDPSRRWRVAGKRGERPYDGLTPEEKERYDALHKWRAGRAKLDGVPVYVILVNKQMADIARARPETIGALQAIDGIGAGRTERYGEDIMRVLVPTDAAAPMAADPRAGETNEATVR